MICHVFVCTFYTMWYTVHTIASVQLIGAPVVTSL